MNRCISLCIALLLLATTVCAEEVATGRLTGVWAPRKIGPIANGLVYVFNAEAGQPPRTSRFFRRIPDVVEKTDEKGAFSIGLEEGSYYLSLQKKADSDLPGPPQDGDLSGVIRNKKGAPVIYTVKKGRTTDLGILRNATVYKSPFVKTAKGMTGISGVVTGVNGSPLANAVVLVYDRPETNGKPSFISHKTKKDGKYLVQVDQEGNYYVTIRAVEGGGRPKPGDLFGVYGGETPVPVEVRRQHVTSGIDIKVTPFSDIRPN